MAAETSRKERLYAARCIAQRARRKKEKELLGQQLLAQTESLKHVNSKLQTSIACVHNLQVEIQELRSELRATTALFAALVDDPESRRHAEAVLKDFLFHKNNPK